MKKLTLIAACLCFGFSYAATSTLMLGLHWNKLYTWRYWQFENGISCEKMTILNEDAADVTLQFVLAKIIDDGLHVTTTVDTPPTIVGGPWKIPAHDYLTVDVPVLNKSNSTNYLFRVYKDSLKDYCLTQISTPKPDSIILKGIFQTTEGVNGSGGNSPYRWWEHKSLFLKGGKRSSVTLVLESLAKEQPFVLVLKWPDSLLGGRQSLICLKTDGRGLKIDSTSSIDFAYKKVIGNARVTGFSYTLQQKNDSNKIEKYYPINFLVQAPTVKRPTMMFLSVSYFSMIGNGGDFSLPLIVVP
jgi:hypothetical protein